jgi:hypothetical protein
MIWWFEDVVVGRGMVRYERRAGLGGSNGLKKRFPPWREDKDLCFLAPKLRFGGQLAWLAEW